MNCLINWTMMFNFMHHLQLVLLIQQTQKVFIKTNEKLNNYILCFLGKVWRATHYILFKFSCFVLFSDGKEIMKQNLANNVISVLLSLLWPLTETVHHIFWTNCPKYRTHNSWGNEIGGNCECLSAAGCCWAAGLHFQLSVIVSQPSCKPCHFLPHSTAVTYLSAGKEREHPMLAARFPQRNSVEKMAGSWKLLLLPLLLSPLYLIILFLCLDMKICLKKMIQWAHVI